MGFNSAFKGLNYEGEDQSGAQMNENGIQWKGKKLRPNLPIYNKGNRAEAFVTEMEAALQTLSLYANRIP
jgi:hypothetical protein